MLGKKMNTIEGRAKHVPWCMRCNYLIYLYNLMMAWLLKNIGFVEPEGETIQILFRWKSGGLSLALLIHPVPMNVHESQIVDGRERRLQIEGQTERLGVTMQLSLAGRE